jgi:hypothetical protein
MIRIFGDFNALSGGHIPLYSQGSLEDIRKQNVELREGLRVIVYDDQCQADAIVEKIGGEWYGRVVESTVRVRSPRER